MKDTRPGTEIPEELQALLKDAPPPIKSLLESALKSGKGIKIIDMTSKGEKKEAPKEEAPKEEKPSGRGPLGGLLDMLLKPPSSLDMLKVVVTKTIAEELPDCHLCIELTRDPVGPPVAMCLRKQETAAEVLLKGVIKVTENTTTKEKVDVLAKVFRTKASDLMDFFKESGLFGNKDEEKEGA